MYIKELEGKYLYFFFPHGLTMRLPIAVVAENRADYYKAEFGGDLEASLREDTVPLFLCDDYEIQDWLANNMDWGSFSEELMEVENNTPNPEEVWQSGEVEYKTNIRGRLTFNN